MGRRTGAFVGRSSPSSSPRKWRSWASAAEWNVRAGTPCAPSRASRSRISVAALSVKVTARISPGANVPVATWLAIRRVIVVVLPEPAPARMHTGPRTASTARRCSGLRPATMSSLATPARLASEQVGISFRSELLHHFGDVM